jgi:hypothetical protein
VAAIEMDCIEFLTEHCETMMAAFEEAGLMLMQDLADLSREDVQQLFGGKIGPKNCFTKAVQQWKAEQNGAGIEAQPVVAVTNYQSYVSHGNTTNNYDISVRGGDPKKENANGWGGERAKNQFCTDPGNCQLQRTPNRDYFKDGRMWAGGFLAEEAYVIMQSKGGVGGLDHNEYDLCLHMTGCKLGINYNFDARAIPFPPVVNEFNFVMERDTGTSPQMMTQLKRDVGNALRNRISIKSNGRSPSKGIPYELLDRIADFPTRYQEAVADILAGKKTNSITINCMQILDAAGFKQGTATQLDLRGYACVTEEETSRQQQTPTVIAEVGNEFEMGLGTNTTEQSIPLPHSIK